MSTCEIESSINVLPSAAVIWFVMISRAAPTAITIAWSRTSLTAEASADLICSSAAAIRRATEETISALACSAAAAASDFADSIIRSA